MGPKQVYTHFVHACLDAWDWLRQRANALIKRKAEVPAKPSPEEGLSPQREGYLYPYHTSVAVDSPVARNVEINVNSLTFDTAAFIQAMDATRALGSSFQDVANSARNAAAALARINNHTISAGSITEDTMREYFDRQARDIALRINENMLSRLAVVDLGRQRNSDVSVMMHTRRRPDGTLEREYIRLNPDKAATVHPDAGNEVKAPRMKRTVCGVKVMDVRMKDGSVRRTGDVGHTPVRRAQSKIPGKRGK